MDFSNLEWMGEKGSDRGRDLRATKTIQILPGKQEASKWMVQCKRYTKRKLGKNDFIESLRWAKAYNPDYYLLITTTNLNANARDWLDLERENNPFKIKLIERPLLEELVREKMDAIRPYIPNDLYNQFAIGKFIKPIKKTTVEDIFGLKENIKTDSLKSLLLEKNTIANGSIIDGPVYGLSVVVEPECTIRGPIYAKRGIIIGNRAKVEGEVICPGSIELNNCEVDDVCGSQIILRTACTINGDLITDRDLHIPPESSIENIYCSGSKVVIGKNSILKNVLAKGDTIINENVRITDSLHSSEIKLMPGCNINNISLIGNIEIPDKVKIKSLSTLGAVTIGKNVKISKISTVGDVILNHPIKIQEVSCRNFTADSEIEIKKMFVDGSVSIIGTKGRISGSLLIVEGNADLNIKSNVLTIIAKGDVSLGNGSSFDYLTANNLKTGDNVVGGDIRGLGTVLMGNNCLVGSLQAIGDIEIQNEFESKDWTIYSKKGKIRGQEKIILGGENISIKDIIDFKNATLLTTITDKKQLNLIQKIAEG